MRLQALAALAAQREGAAALAGQPRVLKALTELLVASRPPAWQAPLQAPDKLTAHVATIRARRGPTPRPLNPLHLLHCMAPSVAGTAPHA